MAANFPASITNASATQQLNRRISNQVCCTQDKPVWGYPAAFYPGYCAQCDGVSSSNCCHPLPPCSTSQVPIYMPLQPAKNHCFQGREENPFLLNMNMKRVAGFEEVSLPQQVQTGNQATWCGTTTSLASLKGQRSKLVKSTEHQCLVPGCGKTYERSSHLKAHLRWHGNPAPFKCKSASCGKRFSSLNKLEVHKKSHEEKNDEIKITPELGQKWWLDSIVARKCLYYVFQKMRRKDCDKCSPGTLKTL